MPASLCAPRKVFLVFLEFREAFGVRVAEVQRPRSPCVEVAKYIDITLDVGALGKS